MTRIISQFQVSALGTTRDECIGILDETCNAILDITGGAPWQMTDDDFKRVPAMQVAPPLADHDGFCYYGVRTLVYRGPAVRQTNMIEHEGHKVQNTVVDDGE